MFKSLYFVSLGYFQRPEEMPFRLPLQTVSAVVSISKVIMGSILVSMALCRLVGAYLYAMESV